MTYEEKIQKICITNGIKSFGASRQDLAIFSLTELKKLNDSGLIRTKEVTYRSMSLSFYDQATRGTK